MGNQNPKKNKKKNNKEKRKKKKEMSGRARARGRALVHNQVAAKQYNEMIYLPPNGVNVHYAKTERLRPHGLAHPRTYITHKEYRLLLSKLIFCEWTDERNVTRYYGFEENDAYDIIENRDTANMQAGDPALIVPLSQSRDHKGGFYDKLSDARKRFLDARASHSNREKSGDTMAAFLVFFASVARHDDPVAAETLSPIECIARAALVAHEHDEEKRRNAMELLAQQKSYSVQDEMSAWFVDIVCDVITFWGVFGYEAYRLVDYVVFLLARATGTGIGRMLSACLGDNAYMCLAIVILDLLVAVGTVLAPFMLGFSGAAIAVAASSATGEAKARCKSNALDWLLGSLSNQMIRIVSTLLQKVAFSKNVDEIVAAAMRMLELKNIWYLGTSIVLSELFSKLDGLVKREIDKRLNSLGSRIFACFVRLAAHFAISKAIETMMSPELGGMYRRMLVPKWMNIAVMGAESAKAEEQRKLLDMAELQEGKVAAADIALRDADAEKKTADDKMTEANKELWKAAGDVSSVKHDIDEWGKTDGRNEDILNEMKTVFTKARKKGREAYDKAEIARKGQQRATEKVENARIKMDSAVKVAARTRKLVLDYEQERSTNTDDAKAKAGNVKQNETQLKQKRDALNDAQNPKTGNEETVNAIRGELHALEKEAAKATEESRIADEKDRYRNAAVRDLEQKEEYAHASKEATEAFQAAETAYKEAKDSANKATNGSTSNSPNGSEPAQNKSDGASAQNLTTLKTAMDEAETAAREAKAKAEPSFMRKTLTGIAEWWTGNSGKSSQKKDSGTKMGMAHFV